MPPPGPDRAEDAPAALAAKIARVFADVPRPGPGELLHPSCRDPAPVAPFERWATWQAIPREALCRDYDALSFFGPEAFRFFLPAFLTATLALFRTSTEYVSDATVYELNPHSDYARSRYALFTPPECAVVAEFLRLMIAHPDHADAGSARAALDGFWAGAAGAPSA